MRTYLHSVLQDADFRAEAHLQGIVETALDSTDPEWLADVLHLVQAQHFPARSESEPPPAEPWAHRQGCLCHTGLWRQ